MPAEQHSEAQDLFALLPVSAKHVFMVKPMFKYFVESETGLEDVTFLYIDGQCQPLTKENNSQICKFTFCVIQFLTHLAFLHF